MQNHNLQSVFFDKSPNIPQVSFERLRIQAVLTMKLTAQFCNSHVQVASSSNQLVIDRQTLLRHPSLPDCLHQSTEVVEQCQVRQLAQKVGHFVVAFGKVKVGAQVSLDGNCDVAACCEQHNTTEFTPVFQPKSATDNILLL